MNNTNPLTPAQRASIHDRARIQALALRRAAVDDTWQAVLRFAAEALRAAHHMLLRWGTRSNRPSGV